MPSLTGFRVFNLERARHNGNFLEPQQNVRCLLVHPHPPKAVEHGRQPHPHQFRHIRQAAAGRHAAATGSGACVTAAVTRGSCLTRLLGPRRGALWDAGSDQRL
jgi:hypothetical protein